MGISQQPPPPPPYYAPPEGPPPPPPLQQQQQPSPHVFPAPPSYGTVAGTTVTNWTQLRDEPQTVLCPHCGQLVETMTDYQNGSATFFSAIFLFLFGCHSGGCLIPFCCPMCQDVVHTCPACHLPVATYSRLSQQAVYET
ncbi:LITAF-like zinc ribbon domain-containing protein [Dichotomocladium elegans]|nr:LITAF-like zinc ribbon domain-containing protein [Dichotomocladium elegans]